MDEAALAKSAEKVPRLPIDPLLKPRLIAYLKSVEDQVSYVKRMSILESFNESL